MSQIKKMPLKDIGKMIEIVSKSFPGFGIKTDDDKKKATKRIADAYRTDKAIEMFGIYDKNKLTGGIRFFDFDMCYHGQNLKIGGGGLLAIDLLSKREHKAKQLMERFISYYREKGFSMTSLYPFRPDFYRKMGWGYGAKINEHIFKPSHLPYGEDTQNIIYLDKRHQTAMIKCYNKFASKTHGMFQRCEYEKLGLFGPEIHNVGLKSGRDLKGYLKFQFKPSSGDNFVYNDLHIIEAVYDNRDTLVKLFSFLRKQSDQVNKIYFPTTDDNFHFVPFDPRNGSANIIARLYHELHYQGIGLMYRLIDIPAFFKKTAKYSFNGVDLRLKLSVRDSFCKAVDGAYVVHFKNGKPSLAKKNSAADVEIELDVSDLSSLVVGATDFKSLYKYGLADISDAKHLDAVNLLFYSYDKPACRTFF